MYDVGIIYTYIRIVAILPIQSQVCWTGAMIISPLARPMVSLGLLEPTQKSDFSH